MQALVALCTNVAMQWLILLSHSPHRKEFKQNYAILGLPVLCIKTWIFCKLYVVNNSLPFNIVDLMSTYHKKKILVRLKLLLAACQLDGLTVNLQVDQVTLCKLHQWCLNILSLNIAFIQSWFSLRSLVGEPRLDLNSHNFNSSKNNLYFKAIKWWKLLYDTYIDYWQII